MRLEYLLKLLKLKHYLFFLIAIIMYFLGGGVSRLFGTNNLNMNFWLGMIWIIGILCGIFFLNSYFSPLNYFEFNDEQLLWFRNTRKNLLLVALFSLTSCVLIPVILLRTHSLSVNLGIIFSLTIVISVIMTVFSSRISNSSYLELLFSIFLGCIIPSTSFFILIPVYHNVLVYITFPMTCLTIASILALDFSTYARDQKIDKKTFLRSLTWQNAIPIHNSLVIGFYVFFVLGYFIGIPHKLLWPALLTFPLACLQIYWLFRISRGKKPIWSFFNSLVISVIGLTAYFITFTLWIN